VHPGLARLHPAVHIVSHAPGTVGRGAGQTINDPVNALVNWASEGEWGIKSNGGDMLAAAYSRITAHVNFGKFGTPKREIWILKNGGGGWDHPVHIHFEEGQILERDGSLNNVPQSERGCKGVYHLRLSSSEVTELLSCFDARGNAPHEKAQAK